MLTETKSLTGKKWVLQENAQNGEVMKQLAARRGINLLDPPTWQSLVNPVTLGDMGKACDRIHNAVSRREIVGIIGDYDADGITGTVQLVRFFRRNYLEPEVILPNRIKHGYGVRSTFVEDLHAKGVSLIITVDTGVGAIEEIAQARALGIDVIVTDHHSCHATLPDALIVHPFAKSKHSNINLSGSGVVFTLLRALENDDWEEKNIDVTLAAIGTVADVMPLTGENRVIVALGLEAMSNGKDDPVFDLARSTVKDDEMIASSDIGFRIAPRINAAGRIADPYIAYKALLEGGEAIHMLNALNEERKKMVMQVMEEVEEVIDISKPILILHSPSFHPGIVGLIAGRLCEKYGRPALVGAVRGDTVTCSLRSISKYHITEALGRCSEYLEGFGGHAAAAGCRASRVHWAAFADVLRCDAENELKTMDLVPSINIDLALSAEDISLELIHNLSKLEPFGAGNPEPRFLLKNQMISGMRTVGKEDQHLQCFVSGIKSVGFGLGNLLPSISDQIDVVCRLGVDKWDGTERVQVFVEDMATTSL